MITIGFKQLHPDAKLPIQAHTGQLTGDTGYDIYSIEDKVIQPDSSQVIETGIQVYHITEGYWFRIQARSGLGFKYSITPHMGIIDNGFRGQLGIKLYNFGKQSYSIHKGDRIAQLVVYPLIHAKIQWYDEKTQSKRDENGFGSTGGIRNE